MLGTRENRNDKSIATTPIASEGDNGIIAGEAHVRSSLWHNLALVNPAAGLAASFSRSFETTAERLVCR